MSRLILITAVALMLFTISASATIIYVPDDYSTIQTGINASSEGDTVLVSPGDYYENLLFHSHNIVLGSMFLTTGDTAYILSTVIDGDSSGTVVYFNYSNDSLTVLTGFMIRNGLSENFAGGIRCVGASPVICNNIIINNSAQICGGILCSASSAKITNNVIRDNISNEFGGGIACLNGTQAVIRDNFIQNNTADTSGGGIHVDNSNPDIIDNIIDNNSAHIGSGIFCGDSAYAFISGNTVNENSMDGIYCLNYSDPVISGNDITGNNREGIYINEYSNPFIFDNTISENSRGIYCKGESEPEIRNNTISDNISSVSGAGVYCQDADPIIVNNLISGNIATGSNSGGAGILCSNAGPKIIRNNIIDNACDNKGGGIFCFNFRDSIKIEFNNIIGNSAGSGGGIYCEHFRNTQMTTRHNVIASNFAAEGGGIYYSKVDALLECETYSGNIASDNGGAFYSYTSNFNLTNIILWDNSPQEGYFSPNGNPSSITVKYSNVLGGEVGIETNDNGTIDWLEGNIDINPLFRDPDNGDFHLQDSIDCGDLGFSPCIDVGDIDFIDEMIDCDRGLATLLCDIGAYGGDTISTAIPDIEKPTTPDDFILSQNYPNPFNAQTTIQYSLPKYSHVVLDIYNVLGRKVETLVNGEQIPGHYMIVWNAQNKATGLYLYRIQTEDYCETKKMMLLK